jgi:hypothetical protein
MQGSGVSPCANFSSAEKHAETRPPEPPPRVFHVTGTFKDPKDAATVLSGSRQDEVSRQ